MRVALYICPLINYINQLTKYVPASTSTHNQSSPHYQYLAKARQIINDPALPAFTKITAIDYKPTAMLPYMMFHNYTAIPSTPGSFHNVPAVHPVKTWEYKNVKFLRPAYNNVSLQKNAGLKPYSALMITAQGVKDSDAFTNAARRLVTDPKHGADYLVILDPLNMMANQFNSFSTAIHAVHLAAHTKGIHSIHIPL